MLCSIAAASCLAVTAAHAPAVSTPRTDVSSRTGPLGGLLVEHLGEEVLGDRAAAHNSARAACAGFRGAAQRQRRHLQCRGPPLAALMKQGQLVS